MKCRDDALPLVHYTCAGDDQAFAELYRKYRRAIRGYICTRCFDDNYVDDLEQNAWLEIHKKLDTYDPERATLSV